MILRLFLSTYMPQPENPPSLDINVFLELWLMKWSLNQKEEDLGQMKATIQSHTVKLHAINDKLQVVQEELIKVSISMCMNN